MVQTIVSGVIQEIRSSAGQVSAPKASPKPIKVSERPNGSDVSDDLSEFKASIHLRDRVNRASGTPRSSSPTKRKSISQERLQDEFSPFEPSTSGDGLAVLLKACEILDKDNEINLYDSGLLSPASPRKTPRSPTKSPRRTSRSSSPTKTRPQGPCTNPHCLNPSESPQWRRGPSEAPILCNACGTRWIRNKSLIPIVPQRGIRYNNKSGARNNKKLSLIEEDLDVMSGEEALSQSLKNDSESKNNGDVGHDQKRTVFTLVASSHHPFQPPQRS